MPQPPLPTPDAYRHLRPPYTLTRKEAAESLNVTIRTLDRYLKKGILKHIRVGEGRRWILVSEESLKNLATKLSIPLQKINFKTKSASSEISKNLTLEVGESSPVSNPEKPSPQNPTEPSPPSPEFKISKIYKELYEETKTELTSARKRLEGANYRVGELEAQLKNTIPLLEYRKIETEKTKLLTSVEKLKQDLSTSSNQQYQLSQSLTYYKKQIRTEKTIHHFYLFLLVVLIFIWSLLALFPPRF